MSDTAAPEQGFYTIREFSATFKLGRSTVYDELATGRLKAQKVRGKTLVEKSEAIRWAKAWQQYQPKTPRAA